MSSYQGLFIA